MTSSSDVRNMPTVISSFGGIVEKFCIEYAVTCNMMCEMISCRIRNWINRYSCKRPPKKTLIVLKWSHLIANI